MTAVSFFNNKGGVGKTTLVCNVAASMAEHFSLSVLLVDADPQCNATQLVLSEELVEEIYSRQTKGRGTPGSPARNTLFDLLEPIAKGESSIKAGIKPVRAIRNRFNIDVIPGNPRVALLEDRLSQAWVDFGSGDVGGARRTNWATALMDQLASDYDIILIDVGPSLGALNRSVLIGVDYFVTPMGCDLFSIMGISNISEWLDLWQKSYRRSIDTCLSEWSDSLEEYSVRNFDESPLRFAGYTVQQYVAKSIRGERRATKAYETILKRIPKAIASELGKYAEDSLDDHELHLGDVPNMYSLVPLAQDAHAPIQAVDSKDGLIGAQYSQKETYVGFIEQLTRSILTNVGMSVS